MFNIETKNKIEDKYLRGLIGGKISERILTIFIYMYEVFNFFFFFFDPWGSDVAVPMLHRLKFITKPIFNGKDACLKKKTKLV